MTFTSGSTRLKVRTTQPFERGPWLRGLIWLVVAIVAWAACSSPAYSYDSGEPGVVSASQAAGDRLEHLADAQQPHEAPVAWSYDDPANLARVSARPDGYGSAPNTATRNVIGGMEDLGPGLLRAGEATVASRLPGDAGNRLGNWLNNRDVLRSVMREGQPIRDASVDSAGNLLYQDTRRFITLERDFLRSHRWTYDPSTQLWMPPG